MVQEGANPFVLDYAGVTDQFEFWNLAESNLSNVPDKKSVYFTIRPLVDEFKDKQDFLDPWFYRTGIYGNCDSVIGLGASGTVLSGNWFGQKAAFKFVEIGSQNWQEETASGLKTLRNQLSEMTSIQSVGGSKILSFFGHYR